MLEHESLFDSNNSSTVKLMLWVTLAWFFIVYALALPPDCSAQVLYGSLTGTVTDPSGAAVPGANVQALDVGTGLTQQGTTDSSGIYRFSALLPGVYKVTIKVPNFDTQVTAGVRVAVNAVQRVDAHLKLATETESVTVTAEAPLLQTDRSDLHSDLNAAQVQS